MKNSSQSNTLRAQIYSSLSPLEKWGQAFELRQLAWALKTARVKSQNPHWSEGEVRAEVKRIFLYART